MRNLSDKFYSRAVHYISLLERNFCLPYVFSSSLADINQKLYPNRETLFNVIKHSGPKQLKPNLLASREVTFDRTFHQGCHVSGKCQGKMKFSPGQGKVREF